MLLILKATEPTPTAVVPHVRDERIILPYVADRHRTVAELPEVIIEPTSPPILLLVDAAEMRKAADGEWITVHPNGPGTTGQPVKVRDGIIVGGAGGKLNGEKLRELGSDASRERGKDNQEHGRINAPGQRLLFAEVKPKTTTTAPKKARQPKPAAMTDEAAIAAAHEVLAHNEARRKKYGKNTGSSGPGGWVSAWAYDKGVKLSLDDEDKIREHAQRINMETYDKMVAARKGAEAPKAAAERPDRSTESTIVREPSHIAEGRQKYEQAKARKYPSRADEITIDLWSKRLAADPAKWSEGQGVSYQVATGGARDQTNRGFRIVKIDATGKRAVVRSVADTGLTVSGGNADNIDDEWKYLGDLKRDKKYDR